jgi:hypothetical protein
MATINKGHWAGFALISEKFKFTTRNKSFGLLDLGSEVQLSAQRPLFEPLPTIKTIN